MTTVLSRKQSVKILRSFDLNETIQFGVYDFSKSQTRKRKKKKRGNSIAIIRVTYRHTLAFLVVPLPLPPVSFHTANYNGTRDKEETFNFQAQQVHLNYSALAIFTTHGQRQADRVKFHADRRRNFCRREYVLYETRDHRFHRTYGEITITAQRKLHNLFVYGRSQTAGYLPPRAVLKERSSNFYNATNFLPPPLPLLYRSFTTTKFVADRWNRPHGFCTLESSSRSRRKGRSFRS